MLSLFSLLTDYFFFVILFFFLTFLAVSRRRGRSILSLLSAPGLITCVLKVRIVVAESVKGKYCGQYSQTALCAFGTDAVQVCAVGLRSRNSESDLSPIVCRAAQISLCCRVCYNQASIRCRVVVNQPSYSTFLSFSCLCRRTQHG